MARRLDFTAPDFARRFDELLFAKREVEDDVAAQTHDIIAQLRRGGDDALVALTNRFDKAGVTADSLRLTAAEIDAAAAGITPAQVRAIELAATRIEAYHRRQIPEDTSLTD